MGRLERGSRALRVRTRRAGGAHPRARGGLRSATGAPSVRLSRVPLIRSPAQGIQSTFDAPSFGSFSISSLEALKDAYGKTAVLALPVLSSASYATTLGDVENVPACRKILNDALVIAALEGDDDPLASLVVPVQNPYAWRKDAWLEGLSLDVSYARWAMRLITI